MKKDKWQLITGITSLVVFFAAWQIIAVMNHTQEWFNPKFLPSISDIIRKGIEYGKDGTLWLHTGVSLRRVLLGFSLGSVLSIAAGIIFASQKAVESWFSPIISILGPIPPYALLPIIIIWFGIGEGPKVGLIAYCTFMTMLPYIVDGLKNTPPVLIRVAMSLGANQMQIFTKIMLPNAVPNIFVGMKVTLAMTFGALMVAEMLGASKGLGYMIINAKQWFKIDDMFLAIIMIGLIYTLMSMLITRAEKMVLKWKTDVTNAIEK